MVTDGLGLILARRLLAPLRAAVAVFVAASLVGTGGITNPKGTTGRVADVFAYGKLCLPDSLPRAETG